MKRLLPAVVISTLLSLALCVVFSSNLDGGYFAVFSYPLVYLISYVAICMMASDRNAGSRITIYIYLGLQWLRLVLLPAAGCISGYFSESVLSISKEDALTASMLVIWEAVVTTFVCCLLLRYTRKHTVKAGSAYRLAGNSWAYIVFILVVLVLYILRGRGMYTFMQLDLNSDRASRIERSSSDVMISSIIGFGLDFAVILITFFMYRKHNENKKNKYFWVALIIGILRILILPSSSESRLAIVYTMVSLLLLLPLLFPERKKTIFRGVMIAAASVIGLLTVYKVFHAFLYGSYTAAFMNGMDSFNVNMVSSQIDIYFYGVRNIARNIAVSRNLEQTINTFINDIVRNTFGVHYFFGDVNDTTVLKYNMYIYGGRASSGNLYSSIAYGYVFFGFIFAPLATVVNMLFSAFFEKVLAKTRYIDVFYILSIVYTRFVVSLFACFSLIWNFASRTIVIGALIIGGASLLKEHKRIGTEGTVLTKP